MDAALSTRGWPSAVGHRTANASSGSREAAIRRLVSGFAALMVLTASAFAQSAGQRSIAVELYVRGDEHAEIRRLLAAAVEQRPGVSLRVFDVAVEGEGRTRHEKICSHFKKPPADTVPALYACSQVVVAPSDRQQLEQKLDELRTITVFVRSGCPRCARTKEYLQTVQAKYPGFKLVYRDVVTDRSAQSDMSAVARRYNQSAVSVPLFHYCDQVLVGFDSPAGTGKRLEAVLDKWTFEKKKPAAKTSGRVHAAGARRFAHRCDAMARQRTPGIALRSNGQVAAVVPLPLLVLAGLGQAPDAEAFSAEGEDVPDETLAQPEETLVAAADDEGGGDFELPLPADVDDALPLPADVDAGASEGSAPPDDGVTLPLLGTVRPSRLGLPAFTLAIGLVDGFNPCAMWVLLFLLSILVNLQNRWKIMAVAGSFVFVSGVAYFLFMALTLNVIELFQPWEREVQLTLGTLALVIGSVHVKDFFAFKKGVSLSIPDAAKSGIAARVRRIVMAENLFGAILGAVTLAVLINVIELLCTAGLPALYTKILSDQGIVGFVKYGYLGLYNLAYMFDDALMVLLVVVTLDKTRLQEKQGRWLKLVSGAFVLALGVIMIVKPELLQFV